MKKKSLWAIIALAGLTISSCTNDEVIPNTSADNAIEFGTYVGRDAQTRGSVLDNTTATGLPKQGFGVFAYYTNDDDFSATSPLNYMNNTKVTSTDATDWTYSPVKYWPNEASDKLSFFAYAPYDRNYAPNASAGDPVLSFTVADDVTDQIDLVVADATNLKNLTKQSVNGKVSFDFKHVLSRVGFKVEAVIDEVNNQNNGADDADRQTNPIAASTTISVQEVELKGGFHTTADINMNTLAWSNYTGTTQNYALSSASGDFESVASNVTIAPQLLNKDSEYMMIIPHATMAVKIRVKYTVTTTDPSLPDQKSEVVNDITSDEFAFTFDQGKAYNFVLHLGLTSVKLSATVANWETATGTDHVVNVPLNL